MTRYTSNIIVELGILDFSNGSIEFVNRKISYPIDEVFEIAAKNNFPNFNKYRNIIENAMYELKF